MRVDTWCDGCGFRHGFAIVMAGDDSKAYARRQRAFLLMDLPGGLHDLFRQFHLVLEQEKRSLS